jgi:DNA-binding transcriptional LysR family regulator
MLPSATDLTYFIEVANQRNISRAAERLGISQPTLSVSIKRLEDSIGAALLLRGKTGVELTKAGSTLSIRARKMLQEWEELRGETRKAQSELSGIYTLGCHSSVALYTLPHFLPKLLAQNPTLELRLQHDLSRKITDEIIRFRLDFGIVINPVRHPDLVIQELLEDEVCFWHQRKLDLQSPNGKTLLLDPELLQSQALLNQIEKNKKSFDRTVSSSNLEVLRSLAVAGAGVAILPTRVAEQAGSQLVRHVKIPFSFHDRCCLIFRADMQKSAASRKISEHIQVTFRK